MICGAVTGYCFVRVFFYPLLKTIIDEPELYSNPKYKKTMNIFYYARLYPWPIWKEIKRRKWVKAWWKFAIIGLLSYVMSMFALYLLDIMKSKGMS